MVHEDINIILTGNHSRATDRAQSTSSAPVPFVHSRSGSPVKIGRNASM
jgi:hypothetical protein